LKHSCALALNQSSEENDISAWKLQRIVMSMRIMAIDLAKSRHSLLDFLMPEELEARLVPNYLLEGQLGSRKQAHSDVRFANRRKTARNRAAEAGGYQLIPDLCRSGRDLVQTVVTHGRHSSAATQPGRVPPRVPDEIFMALVCRKRMPRNAVPA